MGRCREIGGGNMGFFDKFKQTKTKEQGIDSRIIYAPLEGKVISLQDIPDAVFSEGILGFGCGIQPASETVYAPFDGEMIQVAETKHALGLRNQEGIEVLIHVGMDTVAMNGKGFTTFVKIGQKVKKGEKLLEFSLSEIEAAGYSSTTAVVVCSGEEEEKIEVLKTGEIQVGEDLLKVQ